MPFQYKMTSHRARAQVCPASMPAGLSDFASAAEENTKKKEVGLSLDAEAMIVIVNEADVSKRCESQKLCVFICLL